jgi:hypothetical protein
MDPDWAASSTFEKTGRCSPFNTAVGVQHLGVPVSFIGKFGVDQFGVPLSLEHNAELCIVPTYEFRESSLKLLDLSSRAQKLRCPRAGF